MPESATFPGIPGRDDKLSDLSPAAVARRKGHVEAVERFQRAKHERKRRSVAAPP